VKVERISHNLHERGHTSDLPHFNTALHKKVKNSLFGMHSISIHLTFYFVSALMFYIHWIYVFMFLLFMFFYV